MSKASVREPFAHFVTAGPGAYVGRHLTADLWGVAGRRCTADILGMFEAACRDMGATILFSHAHPFGEDAGTTGVVVLAESHLTWHHYPECAFIAVDVFVCGRLDPHAALPAIREFWRPAHETITELPRGTLADRARYVAECRTAGRL